MTKRVTESPDESTCKPLDGHDDHQHAGDMTAEESGSRVQQRRNLLKTISGGSVLAAGGLLPNQWAKPVIQTVLLPAHADTSPPNGNGDETTTTTTPARTTDCDGQLDTITLENVGTEKIDVVTEGGGGNCDPENHGNVASGAEIFVDGGCDNDKLGPTLEVRVDGSCDAVFHTSCSEPIGPGTQCGDWLVKAATINGVPLGSVSSSSAACEGCS